MEEPENFFNPRLTFPPHLPKLRVMAGKCRPEELVPKYADTPEKLFPLLKQWEQKFVQLKIAGKTDAEAYRLLGFGKRQQYTANVQRYLTMVMERARKDAEATVAEQVMTLQERRQTLAAVVRTPLAAIDENSPLAQSVTYRYDKTGSVVGTTVTKPSIIDAIETDSKLTGDMSSGGAPVTPSATFNLALVLSGLPDTSGLPSVGTAATTIAVSSAPADSAESPSGQPPQESSFPPAGASDGHLPPHSRSGMLGGATEHQGPSGSHEAPTDPTSAALDWEASRPAGVSVYDMVASEGL